MKIEDYIPKGAGAAVTVGYLAKLLNVDRREVSGLYSLRVKAVFPSVRAMRSRSAYL